MGVVIPPPQRHKSSARVGVVRAMAITLLLAVVLTIFRKGVWSLGAVQTTTNILGKDDSLQDIVTWDEHSLFVRGERVMLMSGEFHPWRLPVPSLWLDIFQKIKAMGFNCVSFYSYWALLEGQPGNFTAEGVFAFEPFFEAASQAGIYLIARPGPYINAEVSFGGYPGWVQRVRSLLRTPAADYLAATENYVANIGAIIAKAQITNGGPVILYQPENEYTTSVILPFPNGKYMQYVEDQARKAGIVVPFISNDAAPLGHNAPGTGTGEGHDAYPLGFDCSTPSNWPPLALSGIYHQVHKLQSPSTPFSLVEFQGGSFDPWGGAGFDNCSALTNHEFARVFFKNNIAAGSTIHNIYMIFGGTNWGNIGHPGGYTSYDYGAAISEDRSITSEKYSELKLLAEWLKVSPDYVVTNPGVAAILTYATNAAITVTKLSGNTTSGQGSFFVVRHSNYATTSASSYRMNVPTSKGTISIPKLFDQLILNGRDSKIMATDYHVRGHKLLYSTAEIFTHQKYKDKTVLVVYTGPNETNELAVEVEGLPHIIADETILVNKTYGLVTLAWKTSTTRRIVQIDDELHVYILDRNSAYRYWVSEVANYVPLIINGPYLVRSSSIQDGVLSLSADFNTSTTIEIIGVPDSVEELQVNGDTVDAELKDGIMLAYISYAAPTLEIPALSDLPWTYVDSLPEIQADYDDSGWTAADHPTTNNSYQSLHTPTSLFAGDYGFHAGVLVFRGHFVARGDEQTFAIQTQGGTAYGHSVWLDGHFLGSWAGDARSASHSATYALPRRRPLDAGGRHVLTVVLDHTGLDENGVVGLDTGKAPRGILRYRLTGDTPIAWKLTGNLGGEAAYADRARGPLNEGGLYAERHGYHLPRPPTGNFTAAGSPLGPAARGPPGIAFYAAPLALDLPADRYDVPLAFAFRAAADAVPLRVQLYVNGWQFGKYVPHIGPQARFPVPEGILNYRGENWIGLMVWRMEGGNQTDDGGGDDGGDRCSAGLEDFRLEAGVPVLTGRAPVALVDSPAWQKRGGTY
ncbi:beta-galactosidase precursor [Biscogniauxia mediterranea]|nr:beta-galactosidase precursor [Biscogniauxia mediterranea]